MAWPAAVAFVQPAVDAAVSAAAPGADRAVISLNAVEEVPQRRCVARQVVATVAAATTTAGRQTVALAPDAAAYELARAEAAMLQPCSRS